MLCMYISIYGPVKQCIRSALQAERAILEAISLIEKNTCIKFVKRTSKEDELDYIHFIYGIG